MLSKHLTILILLVTLFSVSAEEQIPDIHIEYKAEKLQTLDKSRAWLGSKLDSTSDNVDLFFNERFFGDEVMTGNLVADTKAKIFTETGYLGSRDEFVNDIGLDVKLSLPNTQERLKLVVSSNDANNDRVNDQNLENLESEEQDNDFFTGLQFVYDKSKKWLPTLEVGARWSSDPETFVEAEWRKSWEFDVSKFDASQSIAYFSERELITTSRLNYTQILTDTLLFRFFNQIRYFDLQSQTSFSHVPSLTHRLSARNAITYQFAVAGVDNTAPTLDTYTTSATFRRRIHNTWLFFEVEPLYTHRVNTSSDSGAGIFFRLEVLLNE